MSISVFDNLAALPPLDRAHARTSAHPCKICGRPALFNDVVDFNKCAGGYSFGPSGISVEWYRCDFCGTLFTPFFDHWTAEDFRRWVYNEDYIKVDPEYAGPRPNRLLEFLRNFLGPPSGLRILDYGSGAGVVVEGLRASGYDAIGYDPFSTPARPDGLFDLITCFEVLEHCPQPLQVLRDMLALLGQDGAIMLGMAVQPPDIESLRANWWYCAPRNGHCSTFTLDGLLFAAETLGLALQSKHSRHAFSRGGSRLGPRFSTLLGLPIVGVTLWAPNEPRAEGWHGVEPRPQGPVRWTAKSEVHWHVTPRATGSLRVRIPVLRAIRPGFLAESRITVDGEALATEARADCLIAQTQRAFAANAPVTISLHTPPPESPAPLKDARDRRALGVVIPCWGDAIQRTSGA